MRPLDFLGRIKVKLGIVIVLAVVAAFVVNEVGINGGLSRDLRIAIAVVLALIMVQLLARGMIRPLREMAAAAQTIAKGRYGLRVSATSRDEVGELARAFNAMAADLAEVDRQRRELVANVSHELRTPITGLQAVLENIVDGVTPPDLDTLGTALAQTQRLGRLVAQLLDLSRLDSGARLIEPEELDLASLCRQAVSEATLARDDVTVASAVTPGTVLSADAALLAQVLANLLDNAVRHSPPGGTVRVEARQAGPNLEISVTDDGPGIPAAERARVFERFSRLDAGRAADAGGAGLGLAIAKEIVELHGGSIAVSDPVPAAISAAFTAARRPAGGGRRTAPGCRMVVVLPCRGETAPGENGAGESADGPVHAGRGDMDVRKAGAGRTAGRPGGNDSAGDDGADLSEGALVAAEGPGETGAAVDRAGEDAERHAHGTRDEDARPSGAPDGGERPEDSQGERPEPLGSEPLHEGWAPSPRTESAETAASHLGDHGGSPDGTGAVGDGEDRKESRRPGLVHARADQPYATASADGAGPRMVAPHMLAPQMFASHMLASHPGYDRAGHLARMALGAGVGMFAGFLTGLIVSVILGLGVMTLLLFTVAGTIAGVVRGSSSAQRAAAAGVPPSPWHAPVSMPVPTPVPAPAPVARMGSAEAVAQGVGDSPPPAVLTGPASAEQRPVSPEPPVTGPQGPGRYPPPPAYVPPPLFPRPELPDAPRWLLPAAAAAGLVAAVALPYASPGLGFALTAVAMGAAAFPAVLPLRRGRITPWTVAFGLLAYALVSVALFRDADWLVGPVLLAAFGVGSLAVSGGGRGWLAVIRGGVSVAFAVLPLPWFLAGPLRTLTRRRRMLPTLVSAVVTVVLLAVFGLLFSSADAVFSAFLSDLLRTPEWAQSLPYRIFVFCVFAAAAGAAVLVGLRPVAEPAAPDLRMSLGRQVWVIPLLGLNLLFAAFVAVQITVLFGGSRRVLTTAGLTYAQYARSGFFELVTVSLFVLGIVAGAVALLRRESRADRWLLAVLLGLLCAFTLVILASALHRLGLYTDAYGLSRLRASVEATIWWLGAVFVLVLAAGAVRLSGAGTSWFFRALVLLTGVSLLAFAVWDPDARVAETQLTVRGVERLDHGYLSELGAEAVPILDRLPEPDRSCVLSDVVAVNDLSTPDPWNGWNLARARAREVLERRPVVRPDDCPGSSRVPGPYD
ncbi:UNVERIFIED_ORG: signal transduction histidine kinase [Microbispora rosea subsp. rosea]